MKSIFMGPYKSNSESTEDKLSELLMSEMIVTLWYHQKNTLWLKWLLAHSIM